MEKKKKIIIGIILVSIEILILVLIIFEFGNVMHLFIISLQKKTFVNENIQISLLKKTTQNGKMSRYVSSCFYKKEKSFKLDFY